MRRFLRLFSRIVLGAGDALVSSTPALSLSSSSSFSSSSAEGAGDPDAEDEGEEDELDCFEVLLFDPSSLPAGLDPEGETFDNGPLMFPLAALGLLLVEGTWLPALLSCSVGVFSSGVVGKGAHPGESTSSSKLVVAWCGGSGGGGRAAAGRRRGVAPGTAGG